MSKKIFKFHFSFLLSVLLVSSALFSTPSEGKKAKAEVSKVEEKKVVAKPEKKPKIETRQLIYCTATRKIIPVGQFLLKDGVVSAIMHPAPLTRIFITAKASPGYYLVSPNRKSVVKAEIIPTSIEAHGQDGAKLSLLVSDAEGMMFVIQGSGFKPNETVKLISTSYDENLEQEVEATSDGEIFAVLAPAVVGKGGGTCKAQVIREGETLQFKFPWGQKAKPKSVEE